MAAKLALILSVVGFVAAEPWWGGYGLVRDGAIGYHPGGGVSSVSRSPQGLGGYRWKRDADADASYVLDGAVAWHPWGGRSSTYRSPQGLGGYRWKRDADADADAWGCGPWGCGLARSYEYRSPQGLSGYRLGGYRWKRDADAWGYGPSASSSQSVTRALPWGGVSTYAVKDNVWGASVWDPRTTPSIGGGYRWKRDADAWGYGPTSSQSVTRALPWGGVSTYAVKDNVWSASVWDPRTTPSIGGGYRWKRDADAWGYGPTSYQSVTRANPWGSSSYAVNDNVWAASVSEKNVGPYSANAYSFNAGW